jgi:hypothetical protein
MPKPNLKSPQEKQLELFCDRFDVTSRPELNGFKIAGSICKYYYSSPHSYKKPNQQLRWQWNNVLAQDQASTLRLWVLLHGMPGKQNVCEERFFLISKQDLIKNGSTSRIGLSTSDNSVWAKHKFLWSRIYSFDEAGLKARLKELELE